MAFGGYPSSSSEQNCYNEEEQNLLNFMRQRCSQPVPQDHITVSTSICEPGMRADLPEVIYLPPTNKPLNAALWLEPDRAVASIRNSPSSFRVLVQSSIGYSYISVADPNSSNKKQTHRDTTSDADSTSSWPV